MLTRNGMLMVFLTSCLSLIANNDFVHVFIFLGLLRRCFVCRSRGELGSCKDPFTINATQVEHERGVETVPCASGWCGKILETENALKEGKKIIFKILSF